MVNRYQLKIEIKSFFDYFVGKNIVDCLFLTYYLSFVNKQGLYFFHIPKSAGTSICQALYGRRIGHYTYNQVLSLKGDKALSDLKTFTVVRHPLNRLYSAYKFTYYGSDRGAVKNQEIYQNDERFRSFDAFVQEWLVYQGLNHVDLIFRPQWQFVCDSDGLILVDHVFSIENPAQIEAFLSNRLDKSIKLPALNRSTKPIGEDEVADKTRKVVEKLYAEDYQIFGYK